MREKISLLYIITVLCFCRIVYAQPNSPYENFVHQPSIPLYIILDSTEVTMNADDFKKPLLKLQKPTLNMIEAQTKQKHLENYKIEIVNLFLPKMYNFQVATKNNNLINICTNWSIMENGFPVLITFSILSPKTKVVWQVIDSSDIRLRTAKGLETLSDMGEWFLRNAIIYKCNAGSYCKYGNIRPILKKGNTYYTCISENVMTEFYALEDKSTVYPTEQNSCTINCQSFIFSKKELIKEQSNLKKRINHPLNDYESVISNILEGRTFLSNVDLKKKLYYFYQNSSAGDIENYEYGICDFVYHPNIGIIGGGYYRWLNAVLFKEEKSSETAEVTKNTLSKISLSKNLNILFRPLTINGKLIAKEYDF